MFTKTTLAKCALAAAAALSTLTSVSASPAPTALQARGDTYAPSSTSYWPQKTGDYGHDDCDCDFGWDKDHVPKITQPNKDTVWKVGTQQKVTWEVKWDDKKNGGDDGKGWQDGKYRRDGKDGKDWDDGKKCQEWGGDDGKDGKREGCKARLFLRKGDELPFLILAEGFDVKSGSADVTVPNVFFGSDYRVTLSIRDDKPELQSNSEKFKIVKDGEDGKDYDNFCKDGKDKDGKDCKDWNDGKSGGY
ncbi:hypothetical protein GSI_00160 [Ganoderma sinense ZZ0214-1]|uniref:Uncharacterized protein n=1 Tax=Ganoderma sinense ZZ0214-1 TaxID=1077348 RepID=A0A2G8SRR0_9APHY|nr:hypothetical protein GSI_00160 [Ganoderma sinense ZZ0214-1]